jgi:hypothetical protein
MIPDGEWWTTQQLLDHAHRNGFPELKDRQLETWRNQRLIPRPARVGQDGIKPVWKSPPETAERLRRLCRIRADRGINDQYLLRLLMWLDGQDYPLGDIREDLRRVLTQIAGEVEGFLAGIINKHQLEGSPAEVRREAIRLFADQGAGMQAANTVIDRFRSARGHRLPGFRAMAYMFIEGETPPAEFGTGEDVERTLGVLPRAATDRLEGGQPWHDGQTDLAYMARVSSLPAWQAALEIATDDDLLYARQAVGPLTHGLAFIAKVLSGFTGKPRFAGFSLFRTLPLSTYTEAGITALIVTLLNSESRDNLMTVVDSVKQTYGLIRPDLTRLMQMPGWLLIDRTAKAPAEQLARLRRIMQQFRHPTDGKI